MQLFTRTVYLDHNATTPLAPAVRKAMTACLKKIHGNASSLHTAGRVARGAIDAARRTVAASLACQPEQIVFTSGGTECNNTVIKGVFAAAGKGHIVTTKIEHESVLGACRQVEARGGTVTYVPAGKDGRIDVADVVAAFRADTILLSVMHANNETGVIQPVEALAAAAHARGIPLHTDAVQTFGKIPTCVDALGCDFLSLSAHKINGPKGAGALFFRGTAKWVPHNFGGGQERQLRAGTEGVHQIVGLGVAAARAAARMEDEHARLAALRPLLVEGLRRVFPAVVINEGPPGAQLPGTVNATFPGKDGARILAGLDCYEIAVSIGSACTADRIEPSHVLLGMGLGEEAALATIRLSMGATTTAADIKYVLAVLPKILAHDPAGFRYLDPHHLTEERLRSARAFVIDLRFPYERMLSPSIPGARLWSPIYFDRYLKRIPRDKEVILMCSTGIFSLAAGYRLAHAGHPEVRVVFGGYNAWRALYPGLVERLREPGAPARER